MSKRYSSLLAVAALIHGAEALRLHNEVTFKLPDGTSLVYDNQVDEDGQKVELIVSDFGNSPTVKKHHHHQKDKQTAAQLSSEHADPMTPDEQRKATKADLDHLQAKMDQQDSLKQAAQKAEETAAAENQAQVVKSRVGASMPSNSFDSAVLDAWTAGVKSPSSFKTNEKADDGVVERVLTPQEDMINKMDKEEKDQQQRAEDMRQADLKRISLQQEQKEKKAFQEKKKSQEDDYEIPADIDEDIKDLYSDSTSQKKSNPKANYEDVASVVEVKPHVEKKQDPFVPKEPAVKPATQDDIKNKVIEEQASRSVKSPESVVNSITFGILTEHLSEDEIEKNKRMTRQLEADGDDLDEHYSFEE